MYLAWIAAGLLSLFGVMTYAVAAAMRPFAGGEYIYLRDAYGELPSFLYMWTWFSVAKPASIASSSIGAVRVLGIFCRARLAEQTPSAPPLAFGVGDKSSPSPSPGW